MKKIKLGGAQAPPVIQEPEEITEVGNPTEPEVKEVSLLEAEELSKNGWTVIASFYKDGKKIYLLKETK